jgi:hypothetical protein
MVVCRLYLDINIRYLLGAALQLDWLTVVPNLEVQ